MKKKIISSLLAVAMMFSIAIPAVSAANSDVAGSPTKVTKITMKDGKDTYEIKQGDTLDFTDKISVYEDNTKLVTDHNHIRYMLNGNVGTGDTGDFRIVDGKITAVSNNASATLTIFDSYNSSTKARITVNLKAVPNNNAYTQFAESYVFDKYSYDAPYTGAGGTSEGINLQLNPVPSGTKFGRDDADKDNILASVKANILPKIAVALGLSSSVSGSPIVATTFNVGNIVTAELLGVWTITPAAGMAIGDKQTIYIDNVAYTYTAAATTADADATAAALAAWAGTVSGITDKFTVSGTTTVVLTAKTGTLPTGNYAVAAGLSIVATTAHVAAKPATPTSITYDLTNAVPVAAGAAITLGGKSVNAPASPANQTVENQLAVWAANINAVTAANSPLGVASTVTYNGGKTITVTEVTAAATAITDAMKATGYTTKATGVDMTLEQINIAGINAAYSLNDDKAVDYKSIKITVDPATLSQALGQTRQFGTSYPVTTGNIAKFGGQSGNFTASTNILAVDALRADSVQFSGAFDVEVGKIVEIPVSYYPPNANVNKRAIFTIASSKNDGKPFQYAVIDGATFGALDKVKVLGVNAASTAVLKGQVNEGTYTAFSTITVKPTNFDTNPQYTSKISASSVEVEVGASAPIAITGVPAGVTVKWVYKDDGSIILKSDTTASTAVVGKKVGVNKLTATLSNGEKFTCDVTVKAATVVKPDPDKKPTEVPQTGDTLFSNLF